MPPDAADGDAGDDQAALESKEEVTSLALATPVKSAIELTGPVPDEGSPDLAAPPSSSKSDDVGSLPTVIKSPPKAVVAMADLSAVDEEGQ